MNWLGIFFFFFRSLITDKLCHKINIISFVTSYFMISIIASTAKGSLIFLTGRSLVGLGWVEYGLWNVRCSISIILCRMLAQRNAKFLGWIYSLIMGLVKVFLTSLKLFEVKYWPLYWWCLIIFSFEKRCLLIEKWLLMFGYFL